MESTLSIDNTTATDSGLYACLVTLTVASIDPFLFSDTSSVMLTGD